MPLTGVKLDAKRQEELKEAFIIFDSEGKGKCTRDQATQVMRSVAISPTNDDIVKMLGDRDRLFTLQEIHNIISTKAPPLETGDSLRDAFRIFDKDGQGFIDAKEIRHVLVHLGEKLSDDEVDDMIREVEINGENQISYEELVRTILELY